MIWAAIVLLFLAALLHSWYGGNYRAKSPGDVSMAFILYRTYVVLVGIVLLLAGLVLVWVAKAFCGSSQRQLLTGSCCRW